jgi:hypothetical protein
MSRHKLGVIMIKVFGLPVGQVDPHVTGVEDMKDVVIAEGIHPR